MENLKKGDKVTLTRIRLDHWNNAGQMDEYLGATVTIDSVEGIHYFRIKEDVYHRWLFRDSDIVSLIERIGEEYLLTN